MVAGPRLGQSHAVRLACGNVTRRENASTQTRRDSHGWTTPSVTSVEVVGDNGEDVAVGVTFDNDTTARFHPSLIEHVPESN
jgi:hypothetical protein